MFEGFRERHPRLDRADRIAGAVVATIMVSGLEAQLVVGELFGAGRRVALIAFVVLSTFVI